MLTPEQLAARFPDLDSEVVGMAYAAALEAIEVAHGPHEDQVETFHMSGPLIMLSAPADGVLAVVEDGVTLDPDDYALNPRGTLLRRLASGPNPRSRWWGDVKVTYAVLGDDAERDRVACLLVALDTGYQPGVASERLGDWSQSTNTGANTGLAYQDERDRILASLAQPFVMG